MASFLAEISAVVGANVFKWGLGLMLLLAAAGSGFVWGESYAIGVAARAASDDGNARVVAAQKTDRVMIADYITKLSAETTRGEALEAELAKNESKLIADSQAAQEAITHAVSENSACDLSSIVVGVLSSQPARH